MKGMLQYLKGMLQYFNAIFQWNATIFPRNASIFQWNDAIFPRNAAIFPRNAATVYFKGTLLYIKRNSAIFQRRIAHLSPACLCIAYKPFSPLVFNQTSSVHSKEYNSLPFSKILLSPVKLTFLQPAFLYSFFL